MRWFCLLMVVSLTGCQGTKSEPDLNAKPKECQQRQIEIGYCVPGEYEKSE